jgi:tRNA G18 (ribose-2'-O)-methylase SpoU
MVPIEIQNPDDPRIAAYRDIRERDLTGRQGLFVAEGEVVLRTLLSPASLCRPVSLLLAKKRLARFEALIPEDLSVFVAEQAVLDAIAGFHLHRGLLALGHKPAPRPLDDGRHSAVPRVPVLVPDGPRF